MARIEVKLPDKFIFSTNIAVRMSDINRAGHVSWASMFQVMDEASVQFWDSLAADHNGERIPRIVVDAGINYKKEAFHGQTLKVEIGAADFSSKGFDIIYRVSELASGDEVARAKAGVLCYDYQNKKVTAIPEWLKNKLSA